MKTERPKQPLEGMYNDSEMELIDPQWIIENYGNKFGKSK